MRVVESDVLDSETLEAAMAGQDVVYANLVGELEQPERFFRIIEKSSVFWIQHYPDWFKG